MITISYINALFWLMGAFGSGAILIALTTAAIRRGITVSPVVQVNPPEVHLPENIRVVVQQPAPPPAPMDRAALWGTVYHRTLEVLDDGDYNTSIADIARETADNAVRTAFPPTS